MALSLCAHVFVRTLTFLLLLNALHVCLELPIHLSRVDMCPSRAYFMSHPC